MLQAVDDALRSAVEAEKKTSNAANKAFENAVNMLTDYGRNHHPESVEAARIAETMKKAEEEDKSSLKVLNRLKETFRVREELTPSPFASCVLILIPYAAAGEGTDNGSRVSSPRVSS